MDIRLICLDLDGTALQNDHKTLSPRLLAALEAAHRKGIAIVPVTGRQYGLLPQPLLEHPVWEGLVVLCNGSQVRNLATGEVLHRLDLGENTLRQLLKAAEGFDLPIEFSVDSRLYLTSHSLELQRQDPSLVFHRETILPKCGQIVESLEPVCTMSVEKINLLCVAEHQRRAVEETMAQLDVSAVWTSPGGMEITHPDANKGNGLHAVCRLLKLDPAQAMALGDSGNDESMLRRAGLGIAMGNAPEFIKAASDAVTETNENDGAALAIERWALNQ